MHLERYLLALFLGLGSLAAPATEPVTYYHHDALGSPVAATDQNGRLLWRESYKPYGERIHRASDREPGYTGKLEEADFGISYFGARWYDPALGRFLAVDPVGFDPQNPQSFNRYAYANNNPYGFVDPDGRAPKVPYQWLFDPGMAGGSYGTGYGRTYRAQTPLVPQFRVLRRLAAEIVVPSLARGLQRAQARSRRRHRLSSAKA